MKEAEIKPLTKHKSINDGMFYYLSADELLDLERLNSFFRIDNLGKGLLQKFEYII